MPFDWEFVLAFCASLGSALMAGLFFTFSNFVMKALATLPDTQGIRAMQAINVAVLNPLFFLIFFGTAAISVALAFLSGTRGDTYLLAGSILYLGGCFAVTAARNVPLNQGLAAIDPESSVATSFWADYLRRWLAWNHVRTVATLGATAAFVAALIQRE